MLSTSSSRRILVLLFLAILVVPLAATAGPIRESPQQDGVFMASELFGRLRSFLQSAWSETGCMIDPDGKCAPATNQEPQPGAETDTGTHIDPDGRT